MSTISRSITILKFVNLVFYKVPFIHSAYLYVNGTGEYILKQLWRQGVPLPF